MDGRKDEPVLVVEDDLDLRGLVVLLLEEAGYRVVTAGDGQEALQRVADEMPAMILLDMKMPGMNGWEFAQEYRARYNRCAPIVVLTAAPDAQQRAAEIEAEGYLGKPFDVSVLVQTVEQHAGRSA